MTCKVRFEIDSADDMWIFSRYLHAVPNENPSELTLTDIAQIENTTFEEFSEPERSGSAGRIWEKDLRALCGLARKALLAEKLAKTTSPKDQTDTTGSKRPEPKFKKGDHLLRKEREDGDLTHVVVTQVFGDGYMVERRATISCAETWASEEELIHPVDREREIVRRTVKKTLEKVRIRRTTEWSEAGVQSVVDLVLKATIIEA